MGAATRERTGRSGRRASGPSRRQRSNGGGGSAATPPAATSGAPAAATLRAMARTDRVRPLRRQLVIIEAALSVAVVGVVLGGAWLVPAGVLTALLVLLAVVRRRGRALQDWLSGALRLKARRRAASAAGPDAEPMLAPVAENVPGFAPYIYVDRDHRTVGMLGDGTFLTAAVRVEASGEALRPAFGARSLPLSLLGDVLRVDDVVLESAQLVQQVRAAPAPHLPQQSVARLSYGPLQDRTGAPALRMTWVAVKLDPELCREAIEARGGGIEGAQRALVRAADHVASRITGAGFRAVVLDQDELNSAVATSACANPLLSGRAGRPDSAPQRRTMETSRVWRCDDRWHTTYAVDRWPRLGRGATPLPQLVALLTSVPAYATTFSLTVRRGARQGETSVSGHVRVTGGSDTELVGVRRTLEQAARHAKVGLARLDREQLPGVLATLPLGGAR
ncbi:type VII secretion protein EccE [Streptomyces cavourensis]|uniref:type VII secretion protein EccE n=1 Tax=Streptomyces cavourensis TaxID=67258 RepID=UPI0020C9F637|nr:type VII secretion protein EccE [Streptomyces cavourensis]